MIFINTLNFEDLKKELLKYIKDKKAINTVYECYKFAKKHHENQKRKSGDDFIQHPLHTALYIAKWRLGITSICAALLHDILEDTPVTYNELESIYGSEISKLVESITKVSFFAKENRKQIKSMYLRKLYLSLAKDIRVIIIKIADRLHNMETISFHNKQKQKEIANETLEIYSAISHRLGMKEVKSKLEDLSFEVLNKKEYDKINNLLINSEEKLQKVLSKAKIKIKKEIFNKLQKNFLILTRTKTIYSIYRKINIFGKTFDNIYDILALRIIVDSIDECYNVLGLIHQLFVPLSGKFKDYISVPKNNLYQSLHTIVSDLGHIFEIQIRTKQMDRLANYGAAAHWRYKEGENYNLKQKQEDIENKLDIFGQILEFENKQKIEDETNLNFEEQIKQDIFSSLIYILTPKGKVITLSLGSTILDFAYKIHSEIGNSTIGGKINGIFSSISTKLNSGDLVEVITSKNQKPNYNWLEFVKTNSAKEKIKKFLRKNNENIILDSKKIQIIKQKLKNFFNKKGILLNLELNTSLIKLGYDNIDKFLISIYDKNLSINEAYSLLMNDDNNSNKDEQLIKYFENKKDINQKLNLNNELLVEGIDNLNINLANCCMPIPYEPITGLVSKNSKMVKVHTLLCNNINKLDIKKLINVYWNKNIVNNKFYLKKIIIIYFYEDGMIMKITSMLNFYNSSIDLINVQKSNKTMLVTVKMTIKVKNKDNLKQIILAINRLNNIKEVYILNNKEK